MLALSGGMAQRLMVARAIMHRPAILFLDEPTAGLDPQSRIALWDILGELHRDGQTILLTTHYMEEADELCDRLAIIDHGRLLALDTPGAAQAVRRHRRHGHRDRRRRPRPARRGAARGDHRRRRKVEHVDGVVRVWVQRDPTACSRRSSTRPRRHGFTVSDLSSTEPTLETVFINLTGKDLRE